VRLSDAELPAPVPPGAVAAELARGIEAGLEPLTAFTDDGASGVVTTRSSSWWNYLPCATCGHTFRRGDRVLVDAVERNVQHLVPGLECGTLPDLDGPASEGTGGLAATGGDKDEFTAGLNHTWPPSVQLSRIAENDWRLPRPGGRRLPPTCLYCGHTFRTGEYAVVCPCRTTERKAAACGAAVHRDPAAGLPCWDRWQPGGMLTVCPTTTARL
jgi:hypothetical protein